MKVLNLIKLFSFLLLTQVQASASDKLDLAGIRKEIEYLLETDQGTLEAIKEVFEKADASFNNDFDQIVNSGCVGDLALFKYVLSKSVNMDPEKRAANIREILSYHLRFRHQFTYLNPGGQAYAKVITCLEEMKDDGFPDMNVPLQADFLDLILRGHLALVKKFVEVGFKIPSKLFFEIHRINSVDTINYIVENGYDISNEVISVLHLMKPKRIGPADFLLYLEHGLPLDFEFQGLNWLELALKAGDIDIAELVYNRGLRLSADKQRQNLYEAVKDNIGLLVERLAMAAALARETKIAHLHGNDPDNLFSLLSWDMINEITRSSPGALHEKISEELYQ